MYSKNDNVKVFLFIVIYFVGECSRCVYPKSNNIVISGDEHCM